LNFTLAEITVLLKMREDPINVLVEVRRVTQAKLEELGGRLKVLNSMK